MIHRRRFELSPDAINDLTAIYNYVAEQNPSAALKLLNDIETKIKEMARSGISGVSRNWVRPGLRAMPFRGRCIYFRVTDSNLYVLRVVHGRQLITPDDFSESND